MGGAGVGSGEEGGRAHGFVDVLKGGRGGGSYMRAGNNTRIRERWKQGGRELHEGRLQHPVNLATKWTVGTSDCAHKLNLGTTCLTPVTRDGQGPGVDGGRCTLRCSKEVCIHLERDEDGAHRRLDAPRRIGVRRLPGRPAVGDDGPKLKQLGRWPEDLGGSWSHGSDSL